MENKTDLIKNCIHNNDERKLSDLLSTGLDPNYEGGWPIRLAARLGAYSLVKTLLHYRANPHLLGDSGASTLQLAVFSEKHWDTDKWGFLLSCCDSSQLADGAAVAIVFHNIAAIKTILQTGRCNTHIPTTLTGKTVEQLAKGYKLDSLLTTTHTTPQSSPRVTRQNRTTSARSGATPSHHRNLSPSVARFFDQTASQPSLTTQRSPIQLLSPNGRA
ncbi:uncharacterized protein LOC134791126 [Cydia splendana]|uniref:uncharacterized protein LOC134791126 n=1 Tax=Cydia splendana TaxID=1100963 RepID=UPI002127F825